MAGAEHLTDKDGNVIPTDPAVTRELFLQWRSPRFGTAIPERLNNPVWEWLVRSKANAYQANLHYNGPSPLAAGPGWCFDRFGQTYTPLRDGRIVFIAGEHEDFYDPDFHIYNDVVVRHPDGRIDIYGYPTDTFPPTDFHSATVVGNRIVLVGNLGYPEARRPGETQVLSLDTLTFAISAHQTTGSSPGWIHGHKATLSDDGNSILVQGGKLVRVGNAGSLIENIDDWRLHLNEWRWERLSERRWPRWEIRRKDGERNHLFDYQQTAWAIDLPLLNDPTGPLAQLKDQFNIPSLEEELGRTPDLDLFRRLYQPPIQHEELASSEEEFNVHRVQIEGVTVRYVEDSDSIQLTIEGELPTATQEALTRDLLEKLSALENAPCEAVRI